MDFGRTVAQSINEPLPSVLCLGVDVPRTYHTLSSDIRGLGRTCTPGGLGIAGLLNLPTWQSCFEKKTSFLARVPTFWGHFSTTDLAEVNTWIRLRIWGFKMALRTGQPLEYALLRRNGVNGRPSTTRWCLEWTRGSQGI